MPWPYVARAHYAALEARAQGLAAHLAATEQRLATAETRYEALLDRYHALVDRRANATLPPATMPGRGDVDLVQQAILERAQGNRLIAERLGRYAIEEREKMRRGEGDAMTEGELLRAVLHGHSVADDIATGGVGVPGL